MGLFVELAITLSKSFGQVWYSSPQEGAFPSSRDIEIGEGLAEIDRIGDIFDIEQDVDLYVFPDLYSGATQLHLEEKDKQKVWGGRKGDEPEIFRGNAKELFKDLGISIGPYEPIKGVKNLRKFVYDKIGEWKKIWVKGEIRGDFETFPVEDKELMEMQFRDLEFSLGPKADITPLICEKDLEGTIDIAIDTVCVNGDCPETAMLGTEEKGEVYIGAVRPFRSMPAQLVGFYDKLGPVFKEYGYKNFLSLESRVGKDGIKLVDPCCRGGSPPLELQINMIKNLPDVLWYGAEGKVVNPKFDSKFGVELIIHSDWANKNWLNVSFPPKLREKIKFRNYSEFEKKPWIIPQEAGPRIAAVVEEGNNLDDIIEEAKEDAKQIKGIQVENFSRSFDVALDKIKELRSWGINF